TKAREANQVRGPLAPFGVRNSLERLESARRPRHARETVVVGEVKHDITWAHVAHEPIDVAAVLGLLGRPQRRPHRIRPPFPISTARYKSLFNPMAGTLVSSV